MDALLESVAALTRRPPVIELADFKASGNQVPCGGSPASAPGRPVCAPDYGDVSAYELAPEADSDGAHRRDDDDEDADSWYD